MIQLEVELMSTAERYPSYLSCVVHTLSTSPHPISLDTLISSIGRQRPITKGARQAVHRAIKQLFQAVPVAPNRFGWLSRLLDRNIFRHPLTSEEARRGFIMLDELEHAVFFPEFFQTYQPEERKLQIELFGGPVIEAEAYVERNTWSLRLGKPFTEWVNELGGQGHDDLVIMVNDATAGHYTVRLQPRESRDENAIQQRNIRLATLAEEIIADIQNGDEMMPTADLAARLIGRGFFRDSVPADDLHYVLHHYSALLFQNGLGYGQDLQPTGVDRIFSAVAPHLAENAYGNAGDLLFGDFGLDVEEPMDDLFTDGSSAEFFDDSCPSYEAYLHSFEETEMPGEPLSHSDFHLLEAELEALLSLEEEFGYLLPEQLVRREQLAERLFIDPEMLLDNDGDGSEYNDFDDPPFWQN
jgi:hypothetical protein